MTPERRAGSYDLTIGNLWANIWQVSWPMFLIMIFNFLVGFTDVYVAGFIGPEVQAAVGFVSQLYFAIVIVANAISIGTLALVSRAIGGGDFNRALAVSRQSLIFSAVVALGLTTLCFVLNREIIWIAGFPAEIGPIAERFLRIFAVSIGPNYVIIIANAVFRASGEVRKPLITMLLVSLLNIAGDFFLVLGIYPFHKMGYAGIAISTAVSMMIGMAVSLGFFTGGLWKPIFRRPWQTSWESITRIVAIGWPAGLLQIAWNAGTLVIYNILGRLDGRESVTAMAAITNGLRIEAIIYLPAFALNMTAAVIAGQNLGAGNPSRAESAGWKIARTGVLLLSAMALVIFVWAEDFASILAKSPPVIRETTRYLRFNMLSEPFMALSTVLGGGLQGAGDTRGTMWIIIVAMWLIRLPLAYLLAFSLQLGATGVWLAMITSMAFQGMLMTARFHKGGWKELSLD